VITVPSVVTAVLGGPSIVLTVSVSSWRDGVLLAADVPIIAAAEECDRTIRVPERITLQVPSRDDNTVWSPGGTEDHPLASNGQRLNVKIGVGTTAGAVEYFTRGWFLIEDVEENDDTVDVTAVGLLALVDEARLVTPYQPVGTIGSALRGLLEPGLTVDLTDAPTDRAVPAAGAVNYDEDRLGAVLEIIDAWSAELRVNENGFAVVTVDATPTVAVATLTDTGPAAVIAKRTGSSTRGGGFNTVVARGTAADGGQLQAVVYDLTSPHRITGPWSPYPVPYFYASPLLTTIAQCNAAAATVLRRIRRTAGQAYALQMVPNPLLQLGDAVQLSTSLFTGLCTIERLTLPYRTSAGEMSQTLTVRQVIT
jgi:hypothetical protein